MLGMVLRHIAAYRILPTLPCSALMESTVSGNFRNTLSEDNEELQVCGRVYDHPSKC